MTSISASTAFSPPASARRLAVLLCATAALLQACSDNPTTVGPTIAVALTPNSASVLQGGSTMIPVTVTGSGGFSAVPSVTATGLPTGVTATISTITSSAGTSTGSVTLTVATSTVTGVYPISVNVTGSGVTGVTAMFTLTVNAAAPSFGFTVVPVILSVGRGGSGFTSVGITRTNFAGAVALTATGAPAGVTLVFTPPSTTGAASTLTATATTTATVGNATITINGTATGASNASVVFTLSITP